MESRESRTSNPNGLSREDFVRFVSFVVKSALSGLARDPKHG
jgi:hypothetical protein